MTPLNKHVAARELDADHEVVEGVYVGTPEDGLVKKLVVEGFDEAISTLEKGDIIIVGKYSGVTVPGDLTLKLVPYSAILAKE